MKGQLIASEFKGSFNQYYRYISPIVNDPLVRGYFEIISTIILIICLLLFALKPSLETITSLFRQSEDLKVTEAKLEQKIDSLRQARVNYDRFFDRLLVLDKAMPQAPELSQFISQMEKLINNSNVAVKQFSIDKIALTNDLIKKNNGSVEGKLVEIPFSLSFDSDYETALNLLEAVKSLERVVALKEISFQNNSENKPIAISCKGVTYFFVRGGRN